MTFEEALPEDDELVDEELPREEQLVEDFPSFVTRTNRASGLSPSSSWIDLFDWKFEKYLTPWIVRVTWGCFLLASALAIAVLTLSLVASVLPVSDSVPGKLPGPGFNQNAGGFRSPGWLSWGFYKAVGYGASICVILLSILWVRVLLETVIVIFNIAASLRSIETATPK